MSILMQDEVLCVQQYNC